jgi:hypothetical protein
VTLNECKLNTGRVAIHSLWGEVEICGIWFETVQVLADKQYRLVRPESLMMPVG